ncbi:MAG: M67 family metallopeptidase [Magnetococcales bacterium]|nr:M67 family metallopeptidase [Magnetococcales bacterium]
MWVIPRIIVNKILGHAQRTAPQECVGLLSGQGDRITGWHPLTNALQETRRFLADPTEQIRLFKELRENGQEVRAIYHSHPTGSAAPSTADLEQAHYGEALYLIVALGVDGRLDMNGYLLQDGKAQLQELTISD